MRRTTTTGPEREAEDRELFHRLQGGGHVGARAARRALPAARPPARPPLPARRRAARRPRPGRLARPAQGDRPLRPRSARSRSRATRCPTILGELKRHFRDRTWSVRVPRDLQELALKVDRAVAKLSRDLRRQPSVAEIAEAVGANEEQVLEALEAAGAYRATSFDAPRSSEDDGGDSLGRRVRRRRVGLRPGRGPRDARAAHGGDHAARARGPAPALRRGPHAGRDRRRASASRRCRSRASSASRWPACAPPRWPPSARRCASARRRPRRVGAGDAPRRHPRHRRHARRHELPARPRVVPRVPPARDRPADLAHPPRDRDGRRPVRRRTSSARRRRRSSATTSARPRRRSTSR